MLPSWSDRGPKPLLNASKPNRLVGLAQPIDLRACLKNRSVAKPFLVICRKLFHAFIVVYYLPVGSLSHSLFVRLIPLGLLEAGAQGISIAVAFRSFDRTLQIVLFKQALMLLFFVYLTFNPPC